MLEILDWYCCLCGGHIVLATCIEVAMEFHAHPYRLKTKYISFKFQLKFEITLLDL